MNGDDLRDVRIGDPFGETARHRNLVNETVRRWLGSRNNQSGEPGAPGRDPCDVPVLNSTTNTIGQFGILGLDSPLNDPTSSNVAALAMFQGQPSFKGVKPATASHSGRFVVAQVPIPPGGIGTCRASGCTPVRINIGSADDTTADLTDGDSTALTSGPGVAEILSKPSGLTGLQWCYVRLGGGGSLPVGEEMGMVLQAVSQNVDGFDMVRCVAMET